MRLGSDSFAGNRGRGTGATSSKSGRGLTISRARFGNTVIGIAIFVSFLVKTITARLFTGGASQH
jgi:hypothetical protein